MLPVSFPAVKSSQCFFLLFFLQKTLGSGQSRVRGGQVGQGVRPAASREVRHGSDGEFFPMKFLIMYSIFS